MKSSAFETALENFHRGNFPSAAFFASQAVAIDPSWLMTINIDDFFWALRLRKRFGYFPFIADYSECQDSVLLLAKAFLAQGLPQRALSCLVADSIAPPSIPATQVGE